MTHSLLMKLTLPMCRYPLADTAWHSNAARRQPEARHASRTAGGQQIFIT